MLPLYFQPSQKARGGAGSFRIGNSPSIPHPAPHPSLAPTHTNQNEESRSQSLPEQKFARNPGLFAVSGRLGAGFQVSQDTSTPQNVSKAIR
jgi:hypothetical protein